MNQIQVNYQNTNTNSNIPVRNTRNARNNTVRVAKRNYQSSNVQRTTGHFLPEKRRAPLVQIVGKHANTFTQKSKLGNYAPLTPKSAQAPRHALLMRNTATRKLQNRSRNMVRAIGARDLLVE